MAKLIKAEELVNKKPSGLRIFVRLDVSVFAKAGEDGYHFVVNEVTRGHNTGFWGRWGKKEEQDALFQELSYTLHFLTYSFMKKKRNQRLDCLGLC